MISHHASLCLLPCQSPGGFGSKECMPQWLHGKLHPVLPHFDSLVDPLQGIRERGTEIDGCIPHMTIPFRGVRLSATIYSACDAENTPEELRNNLEDVICI